MALLQTILTGAVGAALVTAVALGLQAWLQRRATRQQRRDDQAHELRMAQERHRADLERLDREASHRRREVNQERLQTAHRTLLGHLDLVCGAVEMHRITVSGRPEAERKYSDVWVRMRDPLLEVLNSQNEVDLLASQEAATAASEAIETARTLAAAVLADEPPPVARYNQMARELTYACNRYREALRKDIGAA